MWWIVTENFDQVEVSSGQELRYWLTFNHKQTDSIWLVTYKDRVETLIEDNLITDAWMKCIEASKQDWTWSFYNDVDALMIPKDFEESLTKVPLAKQNFSSFPDSAKRFTLRHIKLAKTDKTRQKRIDEATSLASQGKFIPWARMS